MPLMLFFFFFFFSQSYAAAFYAFDFLVMMPRLYTPYAAARLFFQRRYAALMPTLRYLSSMFTMLPPRHADSGTAECRRYTLRAMPFCRARLRARAARADGAAITLCASACDDAAMFDAERACC